jgi:hypothetical protein
MKVLVLVLLACLVAQGGDKSGSGPAIHVGFGSMYGGLGLGVEYQVAVRALFRLTPFVAAGAVQPIDGGYKPFALGYAIGMNAELGRMHRAYISPHFSSQYLDYDEDEQGHISNKNTVVGPALAVGYKGMARIGLLWQVYAGISYPANDKHDHANTVAPVFGLGIGYKF